MSVLPIVDCFVSVVGVVLDACAEVDGELADECKCCCVSYVWVDESPEFERGIFHEVYAGNVMDCCCAR